MKVFLHSIGCRLNQSEIESMARELVANGHKIVNDVSSADKIVLNTCAVTAEASKDGRRATRHFNKLNPTAEIILTGCYATLSPDELLIINGASRIIPNQEKGGLVTLLDPDAKTGPPLFDQEPLLREYLAASTGNTRAFVKVQDGCDNRCTFCVTTIARGEGQSRRLADVIEEIRGLKSIGYQEAVITGVHLGSYGRDLGNNTSLKKLVAAILEHTDMPRLRISSLEPWDLRPDFFDLWQDKRLLPHLHMPLQSGSDKILRRMARRTTRAAFRALAEAARSRIADLNLSTDLIVGFPGENDADFQESLDFVGEIGFSRLHVFPYSIRPGTAAAEMDGQVTKGEKKARARKMIELGKQLSLSFHRQYESETRDVLWESSHMNGSEKRQWVGYTDNYIRVNAQNSADLTNKITPIRLVNAKPEGISGEFLPVEFYPGD